MCIRGVESVISSMSACGLLSRIDLKLIESTLKFNAKSNIQYKVIFIAPTKLATTTLAPERVRLHS